MAKGKKTQEQIEGFLDQSSGNRRRFRLLANKKGREGFKYIVYRATIKTVTIEGVDFPIENKFEFIAAYTDLALGIKARNKERQKFIEGTKVKLMDIERSKGNSEIVFVVTEDEMK